MWADKVIDSKTIEKMIPVKTDVSKIKHEKFANGRSGQHTWT